MPSKVMDISLGTKFVLKKPCMSTHNDILLTTELQHKTTSYLTGCFRMFTPVLVVSCELVMKEIRRVQQQQRLHNHVQNLKSLKQLIRNYEVYRDTLKTFGSLRIRARYF
jgi:hypothetical protein